MELRWLTVDEVIQFETLCMVYKSINGMNLTYLTDMFWRLRDKSRRELRNTKTDLEIPLGKSGHMARNVSPLKVLI